MAAALEEFGLFDRVIAAKISSSATGGASFEKVGWTRGKIDCQKVYLLFFILLLLRNKYRPEESGADISVAPPSSSAIRTSASILWAGGNSVQIASIVCLLGFFIGGCKQSTRGLVYSRQALTFSEYSASAMRE